MTIAINEKLQGIMQSQKLDDLPLKYLPPVSSEPDNYYFVSYSHLDYKSVYSDIFALQAQGVNIWYDRAMPAGKSWKETAEKYIRPSRCAGVVFYVSENSLMSPAIHEEIAYAQKCGKSCLTINLPMSDGQFHSVREMLDLMQDNGASIPQDKYKFLSKAFGNDVLYVPYSASADIKAEKIHSLKKPPVLQFDVNYGFSRSVVKAVNDIDIMQIKEIDFSHYDPKLERTIVAGNIANCAFANCKKLEIVEMPLNCRFIGRYAFYGCTSLKEIDLKYTLIINEFAFNDCFSLTDINLSGLEHIDRCSFWNCGEINVTFSKDLKRIDDFAFGKCSGKFVLPSSIESIGQKVFSDGAVVSIENGEFYFVENECLIETKTKKIVNGNIRSVIPTNNKVAHIGAGSFMASDLTSLLIPDNIVSIGNDAFFSCTKLQRLTVSASVTSIGIQCFYNCSSLHEILYKGTMSQWNNINKANDWNYQSSIKKIICSDGEINLVTKPTRAIKVSLKNNVVTTE